MKKMFFGLLICFFFVFLSVVVFAADCEVQVGDIIAVKYTNGDKDEVGFKKVLRVDENGKFVYSRVNSIKEEPVRYECDLSFGILDIKMMSGKDFKLLISEPDFFIDSLYWVRCDSEQYKKVNQKFFIQKQK